MSATSAAPTGVATIVEAAAMGLAAKRGAKVAPTLAATATTVNIPLAWNLNSPGPASPVSPALADLRRYDMGTEPLLSAKCGSSTRHCVFIIPAGGDQMVSRPKSANAVVGAKHSRSPWTYLACCRTLYGKCRLPWTILIVSLLQITISLWFDKTLYKWLVYSPHQKRQVWRFLSYTFLHTNAVHLTLNLMVQLLVATPLEIEQGFAKILFVYYGGALAGSLGTSIIDPQSLLVGASAGVYSLLMAHIPHLIMNFETLSYRYFRIVAVLVLCTGDLGYTLYHILVRHNQEPRISVSAHCCGAIAGLVIGFVCFRATGDKSPLLVFVKCASIVLMVAFMVAIIALSVAPVTHSVRSS